MAVRIDGKAQAARIKAEVAAAAEALSRKPGLAVILVGENPASQVYVAGKERDCADCGFLSRTYRLPADTTQLELLSLIQTLNADEAVDGILVQLPLPAHLEERVILESISPDKDVDCFHPVNVGLLTIGTPRFLPCTPAGVMELLKAYHIPVSGRRCVVLGRSNIVGKPMAALLMQQNGTVTVCHSQTPDWKSIARQADLLVSAVGQVGLITGDCIRDGAAVIDVAMNRNAEGKLCGDVETASVEPKAAYLTPVPGGVGPMTRAMLMKNLLTAAQQRQV